MIYEWTKEKLHSIASSCLTLEVSETGFPKWKRSLKKQKPWQVLLVIIHEILDEFEENSNYGIDDFMDKCTILNNTLAWDIGGNYNPYTCIDIDPENIYETAETIEDPLTTSKR